MSPDLVQSLFSNTWSVFLIIVFFGGSIFVHELGHFLAARRRGLKVERFSIGFGPKLITWKRNGVEYCISALPIGGYVALPQLADMATIEGGYEKSAGELSPISYVDKIIVGIMGAVFNTLFAFAIACILWVCGLPTSEEIQTTVIGYVVPAIYLDTTTKVESPAHAAGLQPGDEVLKIDGKTISNFSDLTHTLITGSDRDAEGNPKATLTIAREDKFFDVEIFPRLTLINSKSGEKVRKIGISPAETLQINEIMENSPAYAIGLKPNDRILAADGHKLYSQSSLYHYLEKKRDQPIRITIERNSKILDFVVRAQILPYTKPLAQLSIHDSNRRGKLLLQPIYKSATANDPSDPRSPAHLMVHEIEDPTGFIFGGLKYGDTIEKVNGKPVKSLEAWISTINEQSTNTLNLSFIHGKQTETLTILGTAEATLIPSQWRADLGFTIKRGLTTIYLNPIEQFSNIIAITLQVLGSVVNPQSDISIRNLSGPPGIIRVINELSKVDIRLVLWFVCLLNINLAILNLLPIPVLDGGHILFATLTKLRGKALSPTLVTGTQGIFAVLLIFMIIYVSFFDVRRWQGDRESEKRIELQNALIIEPVFTADDPLSEP